MNLELWGLLFNFAGSLILILVALFGGWYQVSYDKPWYKRYWWMGWRPIFKIRPPNQKHYWMIKWKHTVVREGPIPPTHFLNSLGFFITTIGFYLQLKAILSV